MTFSEMSYDPIKIPENIAMERSFRWAFRLTPFQLSTVVPVLVLMFQDPQASLHQARKSIQDGAYNLAREQLEAVVAQEPENVAALKLLAKASILLDDLTQAELVLGRLHLVFTS